MRGDDVAGNLWQALVAGVPLVSAAAVGLEGQLTVYCRAAAATAVVKGVAPRAPCYRCVFPAAPAAADCTSCAAGGVLGRAVQVDPIKPTLKTPGSKRLKLKYD